MDSIEPFLFNLFNDRAIIDLPMPFRWMLARLISNRRAPKARKIYQQIGGKSPLLDLTRDQVQALEQVLNHGGCDQTFKAFIAMRYWHPMSDQTVRDVLDYNPDRIVLLPLYPQYSSTTTGSSITDWQRASRVAGLNAPVEIICCYPKNEGWIEAQRDLISNVLESIRGADHSTRILFSAHGLPKKIIEKGDPYQWHVEQTCEGVVEALKLDTYETVDWAICYQSRVGRLEWIGPSLDEEMVRAARDKVGVIIVPIAFVSEHSETLVELDIEYREIAQKLNIVRYDRVPAAATHPSIIKGLAGLVETALEKKYGHQDCRCRPNHTQCPNFHG